MAIVKSQLTQRTIYAKQVIALIGQQQPQQLLVGVGGHVKTASLVVRASRLQQSLQFGHAGVVRNIVLVYVTLLYVVVAVDGILTKVISGFLVVILTRGRSGDERLHVGQERLGRRIAQVGCGQAGRRKLLPEAATGCFVYLLEKVHQQVNQFIGRFVGEILAYLGQSICLSMHSLPPSRYPGQHLGTATSGNGTIAPFVLFPVSDTNIRHSS